MLRILDAPTIARSSRADLASERFATCGIHRLSVALSRVEAEEEYEKEERKGKGKKEWHVVPIHGCLWYTTTICVVGGRVGGGWKPKEEKQSERERERDWECSGNVGVGRYPRKAGEGEKQRELAGLPPSPSENREVYYYVILQIRDGQRSRPHVGTRVEILCRTCRGYNPRL